MFEVVTLAVGTGAKALPSATYLAVAIAPESTLDTVLVDGHVVGPGAPLLLDGTKRALSVAAVRGGLATVSLLCVTEACGLAALPVHRALQRIEAPLTWAAAGTGAVNVDAPGRRHHSVSIYTGVALSTVTVVGRRFARTAGRADITATLVNARAIGAVNDSFEVGGSDHEEGWDRLEFAVASNGAAVTAGLLIVESFGEVGR